jgi:hypothetical protein
VWLTFRRRASLSPEVSRVARQRVLGLVAVGAAGAVLSFGTATPVYGWLYQISPLLSAIRGAARFGNLFLLAIAALAGLGLARWREGMTPRRAAVAAALAVALVNAEALRAPLHYTPYKGIPVGYTLLASEPGAVVLAELPFYRPLAIFENAPYMLNSTAHWRPLMNGYSGYVPESYERYAEEFRTFPDARALEAMRRAGVTHVIVHASRYPAEADIRAAVSRTAALELMAAWESAALYRLR